MKNPSSECKVAFDESGGISKQMSKASLMSRLARLEAQTTNYKVLDPLEQQRELEQFQRTAEEYLRGVRSFLRKPPENEPSVVCRRESDKAKVSGRLAVYHIEVLRQYARERENI